MKKIIAISSIVFASATAGLAQVNPPVKPSDPMATSTAIPSTSYPTIMSTAVFSSKIKGLTIYNQENKSVGEIEDIAMNANRNVDAYIISVGGFLGMGEHYVAISPSAVDVKWDTTARKWTARMTTSVEQLKLAPAFKYPN
jgi:sporulation protein YlmC with PRC-barrel domain